MNRTRTTLAILAATSLGCSTGIDVSTDYNQQIDFSRYSTYAWYRGKVETPTLNETRIRRAVEGWMKKKGFRKVDAEKADLIVAQHGGVREEMRVDTNYGYWGAPWAQGVQTYQHQEGTLVIDMIDAREDQLVWRGTARLKVETGMDPDQTIKDVVSVVMKEFPPGK